jgi:glutaminase
MLTKIDIDELAAESAVSTGHLPPEEEVGTLIEEAYQRYKYLDEGKVADYIPALGRTPRGFSACAWSASAAVSSP